MASRHKPRMSLPPELGDLDDGWGEDEQPTVARPSRIPTSPIREPVPELEIPEAPELDFRFDDGKDASGRENSVPGVPIDIYARNVLAGAGRPPAAPPPAETESTELSTLERSSQSESDSWKAFDLEAVRMDAARNPSEMPTKPPPDGFDSYEIDAQRPPTDPARRDETIPTDAPPPIQTTGLEFSGRFSSAPPGEKSRAAQMKDKFAMGDFSGALELAEAVLAETPSDHEARSLASKCRDVLNDMYASRINGLHRVPRVVMTPDQIRWLSLDHRAGFMLSMIDGISSVDDLLDISSMPRTEALRIVCSLLDHKVIALS